MLRGHKPSAVTPWLATAGLAHDDRPGGTWHGLDAPRGQRGLRPSHGPRVAAPRPPERSAWGHLPAEPTGGQGHLLASHWQLKTHVKLRLKRNRTCLQGLLPRTRLRFARQLCHIWVGCLPSPIKRDFCFKHFSPKTASDNTELLKTLSSLFWEKSGSASALILFKCFPPFPPSSEKLTIVMKHVLGFPLSHCQFLTF